VTDVDAPGAQRRQPLHLGVDVIDAQIEVDSSLPLLGLGHPSQDHRRIRQA
jgi:hypothetical protein